jgi:hypothetical protein
MDHNTTTRARPRGRLVPRLAVAGVIALVLAGLQSGVAAARLPVTIVVHPGQSIQAAVNRAITGDTIKLDAGTWTEAVCINRKGLTIVGAGASATRISWPNWTTVANQAPAPTAGNTCWQEWASHDPESTGGATPQALSDDVSALFFLNPTGPVAVSGLSTKNHPANGIVVEGGASGVRITQTQGEAHDRYGILIANSTNTVVSENKELGLDRGTQTPGTSGSSGTAGISISDAPNAAATVQYNYSAGWNLGIFVREARNGVVKGNTVTNNCVGINMFDDEFVEVPAGSGRQVDAGKWTLSGNRSTDNHRFCLAGIGNVAQQLRVSGTGVSVVNMDGVVVQGNTIKNNSPQAGIDPTTLQFPPGGLTVLSVPLTNTNQPGAAGLVKNVTVSGNVVTGNQPWDILVGFPPGTVFPSGNPPVFLPPPGVGSNIVFNNNTCNVGVLGAGVTDPPVHLVCGGGPVS